MLSVTANRKHTIHKLVNRTPFSSKAGKQKPRASVFKVASVNP